MGQGSGSPRTPPATPTIVRGAPKPVLAPPSRRDLDLARPELVMLREIVPTLDPSVLLEILRGNEWDLDRSTDAALALYASLSAEEGTAILGNARQTSAADVEDGTSSDAQQQQQQPQPQQPQQQPQQQQQQRRNSTTQRGMPVILPDSFLVAPRFRLIVDRFNSARTDFTVTFRRRNEKLGITIQEIDSEICIHTLHSRSNGQPLLALEAGIKIGDILTGINQEYFSAGAEVQDVIDILHLAGPMVTLHFTRRHRPEAAGQAGPSAVGAAKVHKCARIFVDQRVIPEDKAVAVTQALHRLKERVLNWESGWISQRIQRWKLDSGVSLASRSTGGAGGGGGASQSPSAQQSSAQPQSRSRASIDIGVSTRELRPALNVRLLRAEPMSDHMVYVIWVLDVKSGAEWIVRHRFREFHEFRDVSPGSSLCSYSFACLFARSSSLVSCYAILARQLLCYIFPSLSFSPRHPPTHPPTIDNQQSTINTEQSTTPSLRSS